MPERMVWPVSGSVWTLKVGSSRISLSSDNAQLFLIALGLRLDRHGDHRRRKFNRLEHDRILLVADRVAGADVLQPDRRRNIAAINLLDLLALVGVHLQQAADALDRVPGRVVHARAGLELPGIDPEKGQMPDKWIGHDLENQRRKRLVIRSLPHRRLLAVLRDARHRRNIQRRREISDNGIEQLLDALCS